MIVVTAPGDTMGTATSGTDSPTPRTALATGRQPHRLANVRLCPARMHKRAICHQMALQAVRDGRGSDAHIERLADAHGTALK